MTPTTRFRHWLAGAGLAAGLAASAGADRVVLKPDCPIDGQTEITGHIYARSAAKVYLRADDGRRYTIDRDAIQRIEAVEEPDAEAAEDSPTTAADAALLPPIPPSEPEEEAFLAKVGEPARLRRSPHYSIIYTGDRDVPAQGIHILERVYQRFFTYFRGKGFAVHPPAHKLLALVFSTRREYQEYGRKIGLDLSLTSGFYSGPDNTLCFFVHAGGQDHREVLANVDQVERQLRAMKNLLRNAPAGGRLTVTYEDGRVEVLDRAELNKRIERLDALRRQVNADRRNTDIAVVSHEATHQLVFNSGLLNRQADPPIWINEGLATFFESARGGHWRGIGKLNVDRVQDYRQAQKRGRLIPLVDLLTREQFLGEKEEDLSALYAHAWGLTYYLMDKHEAACIQYLKILAQRPPGQPADKGQRLADFCRAFGGDLNALEAQWRRYMDGLRPD